MPDEIWALPEANCYAFEDRRFALRTKRKLVLALGLPQMLILTADELSVIVAHELAHVRQQDTTWAVFFFRFASLLDRSLSDAARHKWRWVNPTLWLEWISDKSFKAFFAPVQKGQEIQADCVSAELFGGDLARQTLLREWLVTNKFETLVNQRQEDSDSGKQLDTRTVYQQFLDEWQEISHNGQLYLRERLEELEQESYWDTHPALKHRLAAVSAYPNFGADSGQPASDLLGDIPALIHRMGLAPPAEEMDSSSNAVVVYRAC
jgi:Zn-dependent protease with chaperone function